MLVSWARRGYPSPGFLPTLDGKVGKMECPGHLNKGWGIKGLQMNLALHTLNSPHVKHACRLHTVKKCMKRYEEGSGINLQQSTKLSHIPRTLCEIHDHDTQKIRACIHKNDCTEAETDAGPAGLATDTKLKADYRESLDGIIINHS